MNCFVIRHPDSNKPKVFRHINPYCSEKCLNNTVEGKLQCDCGDSGIYEWVWAKEDETTTILLISKNNREVIFHPIYSSGTAALRGKEPFRKNVHHFWEMKMLSNLYGTDVMVGVGTSKIVMTDWRFRFFSLLGFDEQSWGYSYNGTVQHDNVTRLYGSKFGLGSLIGVHLDMWTGTLEYYLNRKPLGIAYTGLKSHELYPMVCSTAAQSAMKMTCSVSFQPSLQLSCLKCVVQNPQLYEQFKNIPGLTRIYEQTFFWMLPKETEDCKRKVDAEKASSSSSHSGYCKRRKLVLPLTWSNIEDSESEQSVKISLHFCPSDDSNDSLSTCDEGPSASQHEQ